ncbi:MAG TPA: ribosome small subunit-dependent GTPase A [Oscillatoriaceae cyanobacterium]
MQDHLVHLGWNDRIAAAFQPYAGHGYEPGRVSIVHQHLCRVLTATGDTLAQVTGRFQFEAAGPQDYPAVGDWVVLQTQPDGRGLIHAVLPRGSKFSRKAAGSPATEQVVATNVTTLFLVNALNHDFNLRRLERYLTLAWESGANPVVVLNKADLCAELPERIAACEAIALGAPVHAVSAATGEGLEVLASYLGTGETVALLGSSGAGKSTLLNRLCGGDRQRTQAVRDGDDRGRHTTTHRELVPLPSGGLLIDTPGMRELAMWGGADGFEETFEDVSRLAADCRFRDCRHAHEPGCAVRAAIETGELDEGRLRSFTKLQREVAYQARKSDRPASLAEKARWKQIHKAAKQHDKRGQPL